MDFDVTLSFSDGVKHFGDGVNLFQNKTFLGRGHFVSKRCVWRLRQGVTF